MTWHMPDRALLDCLTKNSAKPDKLIKALEAGVLTQVDKHPPFRPMLQHRTYAATWLQANTVGDLSTNMFLGEGIPRRTRCELWQHGTTANAVSPTCLAPMRECGNLVL